MILRRLRAPLIVMISITAISILGMVLAPGVDDQGQPYHMSFFEAFYFVSFMSTTIGFGEIPYAFTPEQRFWVSLCIYPTVVAWLYTFGSILTLMQDKAFRQSLLLATFARHVRNLQEPFYLICGYGATGHMLVSKLSSEYRQCVVIDSDQTSINELSVEDLDLHVPGLSADASQSEHLIKAGLQHPMCKAVAAITNDDRVNLKVAMTTRLMHPDIPVIARTDFPDTNGSMHAFGVHHVINAFDVFAEDILEAMRYPAHYRFRGLLLDGKDPEAFTDHLGLQVDAPWILCGFGRLGQVLYHRLAEEGIHLTVVDAFPDRHSLPDGSIIGRGIQNTTLRDAGVMAAGGIIAATNDDMDNISIVMAARRLNPELFCIARQVLHANDALFAAANIDMLMQSNYLVARTSHTWLASPLLHNFSDKIAQISDKHVRQLMQRITSRTSLSEFETWQIHLDDYEAPALTHHLMQGRELHVGDLLKDPWPSAEALPQKVLLVEHDGREWILPGPSLRLEAGMNILFCGHRTTAWRALLYQKEALDSEYTPQPEQVIG